MFGDMLGVDFFDQRFGTLDDTTGAFTQVSTLPISGGAAGLAAMDGLYYLEDFGNNLFTIDPQTGAASQVGNTGMNLWASAFAGTGSGLYEVDQSSDLFSINSLTGAATEIGPTGLTPTNGAYDTSLSSDGTWLFYTAGQPGQPDELYQISPLTGFATDLGSTGVTGVAGSAFVNGQLELFQYGQGADYIYSAPDAALLNGSLLSNSVSFTQGAQLDAGAQIIDGGAILSVNGADPAGIASAPEPATFVLAGSGLIAAWIGIRRKNHTDRPATVSSPRRV